MYKLEIKLKQHTPIIHFQHHQEGATLRATELKPKLDRFIFGKYNSIFKDDPLEENLLKAFNPSNKESSRYKVRIFEKGSPIKILITSGLNWKKMKALNMEGQSFLQGVDFFAEEKGVGSLIQPTKDENGDVIKDNRNRVKSYSYHPEHEDKISKWGLFSQGLIMVEVRSFKKEIVEAIKKIAPYFFAYMNFGTRQNKGFGCFAAISDEPFDHLVKSVYDYSYKKEIEFTDDILKNALEEQNQFWGKVEREYKRGENQLERLINDPRLIQMIRLQGLLSQTKMDYQRLKTGVNFRDDYKKSLLFLYGLYCLNGVRGEKRKIKSIINKYFNNSGHHFQKLFSNRDNHNFRGIIKNENENGWNDDFGWDDLKPYNYNYLRIALGMAEQFEFNTTRRRDGKIDQTNKYVVKVSGKYYKALNEAGKTKVEKIDRYQSPVVFKVYNNSIYVLANDPLPEQIEKLKKADFSFDISYNYKTRGQDRSVPLYIEEEEDKIKLTYPEQFNLGEFLKFAFETCPFDEKIEGYKPI